MADGTGFSRPGYVWTPYQKFQDKRWLHLVLFLLTIASTTFVGGILHYQAFISDFGATPVAMPFSALLLRGFWYSGTILAILGCHELGHYFACRYYDVDASLPLFLPMPIVLTGTLGAFIRIREQIPTKRMLFDIGIAGPIAGFLVAVPALFIGIGMSNISRLPDVIPPGSAEFGEPLLFRLASTLIWGTTPDGYSLNMHPVAFGAWFGLLATALNLVPVGQLDGGHISYALLGRRSTYVTMAMIAIGGVLAYSSTTWRMWTGLMIVMLFVVGPRHPRVFDEDIPLDRTRLALAVFALVMFVLCFTPAPYQMLSLIGR